MPAKSKTKYDLIFITGPTASGKTLLAATLASVLKGEVISADSRQVYRKMNLGTGKDYSDYIINGISVPYHLIDIAEPGYRYNVFEFQRDFRTVYDDLKSRNVFPVVCGGSGMYIDSIITGYKMVEVPPDSGLRAQLEKKSMQELTEILSAFKKLHNQTDIDTRKRIIRAIEIEHSNRSGKLEQTQFPALKSLIVGIHIDRDIRRQRITERLQKRLREGMIDEVKWLLDSGVSRETMIYYGLEYKYITLYLADKIDYDSMIKSLEVAIHQFAKRQMTWFRGMEKKGIKINWISSELPLSEKVEKVLELLKK